MNILEMALSAKVSRDKRIITLLVTLSISENHDPPTDPVTSQHRVSFLVAGKVHLSNLPSISCRPFPAFSRKPGWNKIAFEARVDCRPQMLYIQHDICVLFSC